MESVNKSINHLGSILLNVIGLNQLKVWLLIDHTSYHHRSVTLKNVLLSKQEKRIICLEAIEYFIIWFGLMGTSLE